ncbi:antitoxin CptB [Sphingomonas vulcanisoli]|uniref:FAD assembly factor SdhE n=1 Tax=Sphingomonas vulcanisoli TaxID=1658060 RepID=A0ABX0TRP5_9SPHN|nr:succinate dehydrogenase assembly factor 2 [Sphingomonas vulcanisoli]NIJ08199.1 antitoxin CptB [Sphingomonas vulcanisoli]
MDRETRLKRLRFRASHRGTREADYMIGGYCDAHCDGWGEAELDWYEALLEEQDVDIMAWALGTQAVPARWEGPMMDGLKKLDYIQVPK